MFPHSITVYTKDEDDVFSRHYIDDVYWYGATDSNVSGKGKENSANVLIIMPLDKFKGIVNGSFIFKGNLPLEVHSSRDFEGYDYIIVTSIDVNDVGSELDHVVVYGV